MSDSDNFSDILKQYDHARNSKGQIEGTVVSVNDEFVFVDIGYKTEGTLPVSVFTKPVNPGDKLLVSIAGRDPEGGYYLLSRTRVQIPTDWSALEKAFADEATIMGTVTGVIKGGVTVDVGVRAFMPASRTGTRDAAEMEKLVGSEIRCRITKIDVADEDVVVDRRAVLEEETRAQEGRRYEELQEGATVHGTVRSLADYGAFVDIGGVDALLHVAEISWSRVNSPADVLTVGQEVEAKVIKVDPEKRRISLSMKQLQPHPWDSVPSKYKVGDRVRGTVSRLMDFGAFVELEPGIEGMIHVSEMSWAKKVRKPSDLLKTGDSVEAVILGINPAEKRIALGLKQALGDPWKDASQKFAAGTVIEGPVTSVQKFGAFVQLTEGVEGMVHVSELSDKRVDHPQDVVKLGQRVQAMVLAIDPEKRQIKLSMKQLIPTGLDEYIAEHKLGDIVSGRVLEVNGERGRAELGQGIQAEAKFTQKAAQPAAAATAKADLSSLTSMLQNKWKSGASASSKSEDLRAGQIRSFKITRLDADAKKIEVELE
ncbi:SSU ribosomal protein S1P [Candidatus Koribacter versatilis Ellin345]|uniref:SSU ribosomal protein S1P n=1 Tax=Koribacter versatilis (strain Ellin345) TaxID=204669 RepID=Q1IQQ4_KORVE|nr:30S ribosomal protein S1 [Candidatus Koribacter versatilis]ABF40796.1 SSU ribosomal protein S1P [Candidatus Koribacter versatilis Ellin345]